MNKPKRPQKETPTKIQERDFFQTPNYATDLLLPYIPNKVKRIWECAAGMGKIAKRLPDRYTVIPTDLMMGFNFLTLEPDFNFDAIITNPPFSLKIKFYKKCLEYRLPFALLIPADLAQWNLEAVQNDGAQWLIPTSRIDYITPRGLEGGDSQSQFHSGWLTWGFDLPDRMTIVELTLETKRNSLLI